MKRRCVCTEHYNFCGEDDIVRIVGKLHCEICIIKKEGEKRLSPSFVSTDFILEFDRLKEENERLKQAIKNAIDYEAGEEECEDMVLDGMRSYLSGVLQGNF